MTERPIPFKGEMVRAILDGRKTQTRRVMKVQPWPDSLVTVEHYHPTVINRHGDMQPGKEIFGAHWDDGEFGLRCPYGPPGDTLWVRETWAPLPGCVVLNVAFYRADTIATPEDVRWRPSIHMPRWASRITLRITDIRVERLQDISEDDARAEGCPYPAEWAGKFVDRDETAKTWFKSLWNKINGPGAWDESPWVWVISFERAKP
jgi:hypothetical protein